MSEIETVTLSTGKEVPAPALMTTMLALRGLHTTDYIAFYELTAICRNPGHVISGNYAAPITALGLMQSDVVHDVVRDIVLAAITGDDLTLHLGTPLAVSTGS